MAYKPRQAITAQEMLIEAKGYPALREEAKAFAHSLQAEKLRLGLKHVLAAIDCELRTPIVGYFPELRTPKYDGHKAHADVFENIFALVGMIKGQPYNDVDAAVDALLETYAITSEVDSSNAFVRAKTDRTSIDSIFDTGFRLAQSKRPIMAEVFSSEDSPGRNRSLVNMYHYIAAYAIAELLTEPDAPMHVRVVGRTDGSVLYGTKGVVEITYPSLNLMRFSETTLYSKPIVEAQGNRFEIAEQNGKTLVKLELPTVSR